MNRPRPADVLAGIGGAVLLGSLWLKWYGLDFGVFAPGGRLALPEGVEPFGVAATGWQSFSVTDILLALFALLALGVLASSLLAKSTAKPVAFTVMSSIGGFIAILLVLYRLVNQPGSNDLVAVEKGAWIGLVGAILTFVGSWLAMADDRSPGVAPPNVPRRPAP